MEKIYDQERKLIKEKYDKKSIKITRKLIIGVIIGAALALSPQTIMKNKLKNLERNYPVYQYTYVDNQNSLRYLRNKLESEKLPEFLSKDIKNELEKISASDSAKISVLEKALKLAEQEYFEIINTPGFKEYSEKKKKVEKLNILGWLGLGFLFASVGGVLFIPSHYNKRKNEELEALDKKYSITPSSQ